MNGAPPSARWPIAAAAGSALLGANAYAIASLFTPNLHSTNAWFGYLLLLPILGLLCAAPVHLLAGDRTLYTSAGAGFGVGNLLASGAILLLTPATGAVGTLVAMAFLAGLAFGTGFAFGPAAAALIRTISGPQPPRTARRSTPKPGADQERDA